MQIRNAFSTVLQSSHPHETRLDCVLSLDTDASGVPWRNRKANKFNVVKRIYYSIDILATTFMLHNPTWVSILAKSTRNSSKRHLNDSSFALLRPLLSTV